MDGFMSENIAWLVLGISLGGLTIVFTFDDRIKIGKEGKVLIKQCEAELPRNQSCVLVAVPEAEL